MKLSVISLVALLALSSAAQWDTERQNQTSEEDVHLKPALGNMIPKLKVKRSLPASPAHMRNRIRRSSIITPVPGTALEWLSIDEGVPFDAVYIDNSYTSRRELVCRYECSAGFFNPSLGYHCNYADAGRELKGFPFEFLVNRGEFERLEWKADSQGRVPANSVKTCAGQFIYVGKNRYSLGKVDAIQKVFSYPWEGVELQESDYQVLIMNRDVQTQHMHDVVYDTYEAKITEHPPEALRQSSVTNNACSEVEKTVQLSRTYQEQKRWDSSFSLKVGASSTISAEIPSVAAAGITYGVEVTSTLSSGSTVMKTITYSVSIKQTVPPNHSCSISMVGRKYQAEIPFSATVTRTYNDGVTRSTSISGTFTGTNVAGIHSVVDRCEPLPNAVPCP